MTAPIVQMNDFRRMPDHRLQALEAAAGEVIRSGWYILGPQVAAFEKDWGTFCGTRHTTGVANGLDAIEIGVRALGLGPGDEIITTPVTAFATVLGIQRAGAVPVLADIDPTTGLLDLESAERCLSPRTRAVLLVHLYGQLRRIDAWRDFCARHKLLFLEDAAQAHGAEWKGRRAGALGRWAAFSFYPTKNLGCIGDGGALCTDDDEVSAQAAQLRNYGQSDRYHHPLAGLNSRLDEIQAAMLRVLLRHLPEATTRRREVAAAYRNGISSRRVLLLAPPEAEGNHVYHLFVVRAMERAALQEHLTALGVQSLVHYPVGAHRQPPAKSLRCDPRGLAAADAFTGECLSLPCHPYLTGEEIGRVISAVNSF